MGPPRSVQLLLDRLRALDDEIARYRAALDRATSADEIESCRVGLGMCGFQRAKVATELRQSGHRPDAPTQELP